MHYFIFIMYLIDSQFVIDCSDLLQNPTIVPLKVLRGHQRFDDFGVLDVMFHPTQPWLFTSGADSTIRLYTWIVVSSCLTWLHIWQTVNWFFSLPLKFLYNFPTQKKKKMKMLGIFMSRKNVFFFHKYKRSSINKSEPDWSCKQSWTAFHIQ